MKVLANPGRPNPFTPQGGFGNTAHKPDIGRGGFEAKEIPIRMGQVRVSLNPNPIQSIAIQSLGGPILILKKKKIEKYQKNPKINMEKNLKTKN